MQKHSTKGGYGWLIHTYLAVLIAKLDFHQKVAIFLQMYIMSFNIFIFVIIPTPINSSSPPPPPHKKGKKCLRHYDLQDE